MSDIIKLLPDSIANQIAAGEVIQRPASIIKELIENSIDAKASEIIINIKDAGKTLVQVKDNGSGMSETDARLAFERHATSKIRETNDLFKINTMGFRGEALASIASVAQVDLKTKRDEDELGINIQISDSIVNLQEPVSCPRGSNFQIKNLFFNVPARRKFLKADNTEFRHILEEVQRVALTHPNVAFKLMHNNVEIYNLQKANYRQRIVAIFGKSINQNLISLDNETDIVKISGFVGKPEKAKKTRGEQYFFVNGRFMRHPYFYHAVNDAYKNILPPNTFPSFFIFFEVNPASIDINIHPTKTEIKFEEEKFIYQLLHVTVKEALGKFNIIPSIDFDVETDFIIPTKTDNIFVKPPEPKIDPNYNPFTNSNPGSSFVKTSKTYFDKPNTDNWEKLFETPEADSIENTSQIKQNSNTQIFDSIKTDFDILIYKNSNVVFEYNEQLLMINLRRASHRINYDLFIKKIKNNKGITQKLLYIEEIEFTNNDYLLLNEIYDELSAIGFDITECKPNTISLNGVPSEFENGNYKQFLEELIEKYSNNKTEIKSEIYNIIANLLAKSITNLQSVFTKESAKQIIKELFNCNNQSFTPSGKQIIKQLV